MDKESWDLERDFKKIRGEFPVLQEKTYLISNSLGAVPRGVRAELDSYFQLWASEGVSAWRSKWWDFSREIGNLVGEIIGAGRDEITMMTHATQALWVALSTAFRFPNGERREILMTDHDFPSSIYAVSQIAENMGWRVNMVSSCGRPGIPVEDIISRISPKTLFVATSHVYFKSAYIQDITQVTREARRAGALTIIDGYHAPGTIPVDVKSLGVDFYIGGCLKWLCGGPGNAFLYVNPGAAARLKPVLTGWLAHSLPFGFSPRMDYTNKSYRFMSGTPPVPCLYAARPGLEIIRNIDVIQIREKSLKLTDIVLEEALGRGFDLFTPSRKELRGGAVSLGIPHAFQVKQALDDRSIIVDFRNGQGDEPAVIRIGPHFYTDPDEIKELFEVIDDIYETGSFRKYSQDISHVT